MTDRQTIRRSLGRGPAALARCQLHWLAALAAALRALAVTGALLLLPVGLGFLLLPPAARGLRATADRARRRAAARTGVAALAPAPLPDTGNAYHRTAALLGDDALRRELLWACLAPWTGGLLVALPPAFAEYGLFGALVQPFLWRRFGDGNWYAFVPVHSPATALAAALLGAVFLAAAVRLAPAVLDRHAAWTARALAGPRTTAHLTRRIDELTDRRADALDSQAAELRRIERDLHDGAQARLVSLGLTLDQAERLLDDDPAAARRLLGEVRASSARALQDLRELVHGILPPVLADRGLPDAVRSLALDSFLDVHVDAELPGRLPAAVEGAGYFAVAELLANAGKHAHAREVRIRLRRRDGLLRITVTDDGRGGADPARGTGLRGITRRLAAFDGTLTLHSPPGGPTTATLELPCASSSPKTSSSSATA
ncbi:histidine kinase [Kitasatospora sp. NPDC049285]|uniref:sensor histidine kinase n=1 Tax=Kitasatospora sp. NPDC049285 TaxID=3157096 RepID=UPI003412EAB1